MSRSSDIAGDKFPTYKLVVVWSPVGMSLFRRVCTKKTCISSIKKSMYLYHATQKELQRYKKAHATKTCNIIKINSVHHWQYIAFYRWILSKKSNCSNILYLDSHGILTGAASTPDSAATILELTAASFCLARSSSWQKVEKYESHIPWHSFFSVSTSWLKHVGQFCNHSTNPRFHFFQKALHVAFFLAFWFLLLLLGNLK